MFCTSLRRRPSFSQVVPKLMLRSTLELIENQLTTHDIALPLDSRVDQRTGRTTVSRHLRLLLLSCNDVSTTDKLGPTLNRVRHLVHITSGQDIAIVLLLAPSRNVSFRSVKELAAEHESGPDGSAGMRAYVTLQAELLSQPEMPLIPLLPLSELESLPALLKGHVAKMTQGPARSAFLPTAFDLLQLCTSRQVMREQTALYLTDLFPNLRSLAEACTSLSSAPNSSSPTSRCAHAQGSTQLSIDLDTESPDAMQVSDREEAAHEKLKHLRDLLGETGDEECRSIVEFWKQEWSVE